MCALLTSSCVAHRLRHILRPPLPPPLAAVRLVAVGKSYASKVDDEKSAFESGTDSRQHRHKKSRYLHCSCDCRYGRVAVIYEEILISVWDGSIIQLDKLEFDEGV